MNNGYVPNREPLARTVHTSLPLGSVRPKGWLLNQLKLQAEGLTGHLDEIWDSVGSYSGWLGGTGENWERGPYYCDGLVPLAYLLEDGKLIAKAARWIEWTLGSQSADGNFGPENNEDWWPRMVMLKVLIQYYEITGDERVPGFMLGYFRFQEKHIREKPLHSWGQARGGELIYCIHWLYNRTGEAFLLELAELVYHQTLDWEGVFTEFPFTRSTGFYYPWRNLDSYSWNEKNKLMQYHATHVVNVAMGIKTPGIFYRQSKDPKYREAVFKGIENLARYHGHPAGIFTGDEHLSGRNPVQGTELCAVVEYMFSLEALLEVFEDVALADILEKVAYNALPATITGDFWGHQYLQQPNQVLVTRAKRNWYNNKEDSNLFGLEPNFGCCTANMHQGWPKFVRSLWMGTADKGLAAVVYAPCSVRAKVGNGVEVEIEEETNYPFDGNVKFTLHFLQQPATSQEAAWGQRAPSLPQSAREQQPSSFQQIPSSEQTSCMKQIFSVRQAPVMGQAAFPIKLRVPGWCDEAAAMVNGQTFYTGRGGSYIVIERKWKDGDTIEFNMPLKLRTSTWYNNSAAVERGPLVFGLRIGEEWKKLRGTDPYGDWEVYPTTPWNYALVLDPCSPENSFEVEERNVGIQPFDSLQPPIVLKGKGRRLFLWQFENNSAGELPISPVCSDEPEEEIELIPYGAAKLRITEFPWLASK